MRTQEDANFSIEEIFRLSRARGEPETQEYIKFHKKLKIVIELSVNAATERAVQLASSLSENMELQPITDEISRICPRFRILVIGKTGVGKSSLISRAFGVEALVSHNKAGEADIDYEFISPQNERFVFHDSKGFEPGERDNLEMVQGFIERRSNIPALKDRLHAVWLCLEIPRAGGRLLETGTEEFLTLKRGGTLGNIPVIVVLTKCDKLLDRIELTLDESTLEGLSDEAIEELVKKEADAELHNICIRPLKKAGGPDIPHVAISTKEGHKETLAHLILMTEHCVRQHVGLEASELLMTAFAQRDPVALKINASIEVGKRTYWKALTSSISFTNRTMWDCLNTLHTDIVAVWKFHDPHRYLYSLQFRTLMANMVEVSRTVIQRFMAYLVDLSLILQTVYLVSKRQEVTRRAIKLAVASYLASSVRGEVHTWIQGYDRGLTFLERADRDTLDKVIEVMQFYSIDAAQMSELGVIIPGLLDEPWEV